MCLLVQINNNQFILFLAFFFLNIILDFLSHGLILLCLLQSL